MNTKIQKKIEILARKYNIKPDSIKRNWIVRYKDELIKTGAIVIEKKGKRDFLVDINIEKFEKTIQELSKTRKIRPSVQTKKERTSLLSLSKEEIITGLLLSLYKTSSPPWEKIIKEYYKEKGRSMTEKEIIKIIRGKEK